MRTFATSTRQRRGTRVPTRRAPSRVGRAKVAQRAEIRHILHGPRLQPELTVGAPDDAYEREADRVAEEIVGRGQIEPHGSNPAAPAIRRRAPAGGLVSRQAAPEISPDELLLDRKLGGYYAAMAGLLGEDVPEGERRKGAVREGVVELQRILTGPAGLEEKRQTLEALEASIEPVLPGHAPASPPQSVQRREAGRRGGAEPSANVARGIRGLQGRGERLSPAVRGYFEPRLGHSFAGVRIHTDPAAASLAESLDALAFTVGSDVGFGAGQYDPGSEEGLRLIAHELTHTVQQGGAVPLSSSVSSETARPIRRAGGLRVSRAMSSACAGTSRWPGNFAHLLIESNYATTINPIFGETEFSIPSGGPSGISTGYADMVDTSVPAIYEIKPFLGRASGVAQAQRYRDAAQAFCDPTRYWLLGATYPRTVLPFSATHDLVSEQSEYLGVVDYWTRLRPPPVPVRVPKPKPVRKPIKVPKPKPVPWWVPVGAAAAYILWNSKGCLAGPWGCVIDWATPGI
jgi:hypothetical protein